MGGEQGEVTYIGEAERDRCEYGGVDCQHRTGRVVDSERGREVGWRNENNNAY